MAMTVDEALKMFAESGPHCWDGMYDVAQALAAEVERLRGELLELTFEVPGVPLYRAAGDKHERENVAELLVEFSRLQKVVADQALTIGVLRDQLAARDDNNKLLCQMLDEQNVEVEKLREEAQTARLALDVALKEVERFRGKYERAEALLTGMPKPGAAT